MKTVLATMSAVMFAAQAFAGEPFDRVDTNRIVRVVVGLTELFGDDPFANNPKPPPTSKFKEYFELRDPQLVQKLAGLVKVMKKTDEMTYPAIGVLSEQKFMDSASNVVFTTHIVNYEATVVVDCLTGADKDYFRTGHSVEFCRVIYDKMKEHSPKAIEELDQHYRDVNHSLEGYLFGGKERKGTTTDSTLSTERAPSVDK